MLRRSARKEILALPSKIGDQVEHAIDRLLTAFQQGQRPQDIKPLGGRSHTFRVDTGEYRILFMIDEGAKLITIFRVRHRKDAYRNL